ncbi:response regulator transcription factor [Diaphorobacter sp. HDW4B]|uniref:LytR/AlgR family response regulator transcription factor n=1 Tax=Diaphorobacter sp. HDW4B TaxID=2714925 RepID=UPI00140BE86E|nr:LytTR family DNA-binding domain-containing protein [Diaphorobacter sp. HDW4B]QIL69715.1 response regulator transcription factor [Diaphorobacter sp. HDW4B]
MSPSTSSAPRALIAEDEPLLAQSLQQSLAKAWPELQVAGIAEDGLSAVQMALNIRPDVLLLDIRMPGQSGLDAAAEIADAWPDHTPFPAIVFVTAYDQYAVQAFEAQAMDYLLKPVQPARLAQTVQRLRAWWQTRQSHQTTDLLEQTLQQLRKLQGLPSPTQPVSAPIRILQASVGNQLHMVPVQDVVYFEAADKYVRVLTASHEYLLRTPLKELIPQLDEQRFWQIHRGTVVRAASVAQAQRDESGKLTLLLRERPEKLAVSRLYATRFKAM